MVVHPLLVALAVGPDVSEVGGRRALVGCDRAGEVAGARVDVRRHVQQVADGRDQRFEPLRARQRALGRSRSLDGVDVVVVRADVSRPAFQRLLEHRDELDVLLGAARPQRHQAVGVERGGVRIVLALLEDLTGIDRVAGGAVGGEARTVAADERIRVAALVGLARERLRLARGRAAGVDFSAGRIAVQVRARREREADERHRRHRIEARCLEERLTRALAVETVEQRQPLVEEPLRVRAGRANRMLQRADAAGQDLRSRGNHCENRGGERDGRGARAPNGKPFRHRVDYSSRWWSHR